MFISRGEQVHAYCLMSNHYHLVLETPGTRSGGRRGLAAEPLYDPAQRMERRRTQETGSDIYEPLRGGVFWQRELSAGDAAASGGQPGRESRRRIAPAGC
jgi:hypothetical protein